MSTRKLYAGSTRDITKRFKEHYRGNKTNIRLYNSFKKNSGALFSFVIFEYFDPSLLLEYRRLGGRAGVNNVADIEDLYLKAINPGSIYNISLDATPGPKYSHTPEMLKQISVRQKGEKHHMFGKKHTSEALAKISAASKGSNNPRFGIIVSEESKRKMSLSKTKSYYGIYDKKVQFIGQFETWGEAAKYLGISKSTFFKGVNSNKYMHPTFEYRVV